MKSILLLLCFAIASCQIVDARIFRYKNGTLTKGREKPITITGTILYERLKDARMLTVLGTDYSTMNAFVFVGGLLSDTDTEKRYRCEDIRWGLSERIGLSGEVIIKFSGTKAELEAKCKDSENEILHFTTSNEESNFFFSPVEAGLRAKYLVGQSAEKYATAHVINFAVTDYPYGRINCPWIITGKFPDAPGPEPGVLVVGRNGEHCAILDNEGTKFIHTNPTAKKVTYESIAVINKYFPNGLSYKRYPTTYP